MISFFYFIQSSTVCSFIFLKIEPPLIKDALILKLMVKEDNSFFNQFIYQRFGRKG